MSIIFRLAQHPRLCKRSPDSIVEIIQVAAPALIEANSKGRTPLYTCSGSCKALKTDWSLDLRVCPEKGHNLWCGCKCASESSMTRKRSSMSNFTDWWRAFENRVFGSRMEMKPKRRFPSPSEGSKRSLLSAASSSPGLQIGPSPKSAKLLRKQGKPVQALQRDV